MASESSSAMLDVNDADTEDTEAPSVTEDVGEGLPLIMEHGYDIAVKVDCPMKQLSTLETFVTYRVRCVCARWPPAPPVRRRYNHFKLLHKRLSSCHPLVAAPPLPPLHTARQQLDRYCATFVAVRTLALNVFLDRVAKHPIFSNSDDFRLFLTTPDDEFDKVFKSENSALNLWGLSSAIYGAGESKPAVNGARVKDPEWSSTSEYLTSLQHKLSSLGTITNQLHKGTIALTNEMCNMKRASDSWRTQRGGRACGAVAAGVAAPRPRLPLTHRALLPLLAAYTGAHIDKIRQRDLLHAAHVAGTDSSGDLHNKLEQCSEALRSELSDWLPKTRADIKSLLLEIADSQVNFHSQIFTNWEHALRLSQDPNAEEIFKTVSKTAVQNLSPSRCRSELTPTETERDLDELENYSNDSDSLNERTNDRTNERNRENERSENDSEKTEWVEVNDVNNTDNKCPQIVNTQGLASEALDDTTEAASKEVKDSLERSSKSDVVSDVVSDPLKEFSDVDLS